MPGIDARRALPAFLLGTLLWMTPSTTASKDAEASSGSSTTRRMVARFLEADSGAVENLEFKDATGDSNSYFLRASTSFDANPSDMMVSENIQIRASGIEAQAGAAWFPPFKNRFPGGKGLSTTVHWELSQSFHTLAKGTLEKTGVPTEEEWYDWYADEGDYPGANHFQLHNDQLRMVFDLAAEAEAFDEGTGSLELELWGSTYIWRNNWTPDGNWRQNMPVVRKKYRVIFQSGPLVVSGPPYEVWKEPATDLATRPHPALFMVTLWNRNTARGGFKGNLQHYENPTVLAVGPNGALAPGTQQSVMGDTHQHFGTHPPPVVRVTPDFDPIGVKVLHRQWDMQKNRGKEYSRDVRLHPTVLLCTEPPETNDEPPAPRPIPIAGLAGEGQAPRRSVKSPGGRLLPGTLPGVSSAFEGDVRLEIVSLLFGNPTLELDATPDENDEWFCFDCVQSGDQVEFRYEFRDLFGRHYSDAIVLAVPDSLDTAAPDTLEIRQPLLEFSFADQDPAPALGVDLRVLDLASAPFGKMRPLPGIQIDELNGGFAGLTDGAGRVELDAPHGASLQLSAVDPSNRYLALILPATPPLESHLTHREIAPGEWQDDRLIVWLSPSFQDGRLHLGSGRIDKEAGTLISHVGAVSNIDPDEILSAHWESFDGDVLKDATVLPWGVTPRPEIGVVPARFALAPSNSSSKNDPEFQALLSRVVVDGVVRLRVATSDGLDHGLDIAVEKSSPTSVAPTPDRNGLDLRVTPNPFNPQTRIGFTLVKAGHVRLTVYDLRGRLVADLLDGQMPAGDHSVTWTGRYTDGRVAPSGVYLSRLETGDEVAHGRMALVK